jgi:hypothetical protein
MLRDENGVRNAIPSWVGGGENFWYFGRRHGGAGNAPGEKLIDTADADGLSRGSISTTFENNPAAGKVRAAIAPLPPHNHVFQNISICCGSQYGKF